MNIISTILKRFGYVAMDSTATDSYPREFFLNTSSVTKAGIHVNNDNALTIATVFACISAISEDIAKLPLPVLQRDGEYRNRRDSHPLFRLLNYQPNEYMTAMIFRQVLTANVLGWGNGYALKGRDSSGTIRALWPIPPDKVIVKKEDSGEIIYEVRGTRGPIAKYRRKDIFHLYGLGFDGLVGYNVVAKARESIAAAKAAQEFGSEFFANGANSKGVLRITKPLSKPGQDRLKEEWAKNAKEGDPNHPLILEEAMEFFPTSIAPEEAQFLQTRQFSITEICQWFRMKPHKVGDLSRATFSNIEQQAIEYVQDTLMGWLTRWEQAIATQLMDQSEIEEGYYVKHNVDALLRGDTANRHTAYASGRQWGWLSVNDIRAKEDMNPIENGNIYLEPANMKEAGTVLPVSNPTAALLISDVSERIARAELKELDKRVPKAADDRARFCEWATEYFGEKHAQYAERLISALCLSMGVTGVSITDIAKRIAESARTDWTEPGINHHALWVEYGTSRAITIQAILKEILK